MGNVVAIKKGKKDKKVMIAAHMDEIGFIVTHIDENGFIFFHTLGGFDPKTLTAQRVIIHGKKDVIGVMGSKPIHLMNTADRAKVPTIKDYFIDTGRSKKELDKIISVGDTITRERKMIEMGDCLNCKSLDNRVSVFILIEMFREMKKKPPYDVYGVFTVQEEIGIRGANVSSMDINPDFGFGLDTTIAWDTPVMIHDGIVDYDGNVVFTSVDGKILICNKPSKINYNKGNLSEKSFHPLMKRNWVSKSIRIENILNKDFIF